MRRRDAIAAMLAVPAGIATAACEADDPPPPGRLLIAGGLPGTVYARLGTVLADAARKRWKIPVEVLPIRDSVQSVRSLMDGSADLAFTTVDVADAAQNGDGVFRHARPIAALASLYDDYLHIVVRDEREIVRLADLAGRTVAIGPAESAVNILARRLLNIVDFGEKPPTLRSDDAETAAGLLRDKSIDAFFTIGALPDDVVGRLAATERIRLLPVADETTSLGDNLGEYFVTRSVPANTYGYAQEVVTLGVRTILVVRRTVPDEEAYALVRLLFDSRDALREVHPEAQRLDERSALMTYPVDLHPGVRRYYREVKPLA
jgi:TRAP transporter TAXI family solute receptor